MLKKLHSPFRLVVLLSLAFSLSQCTKDEPQPGSPIYSSVYEFDNSVAQEWNTLISELERFTPGYRPPIAARNVAYISLAAYESVVPGMADRYNSVARDRFDVSIPEIQSNESYFWPLVLNSAYKTSVQFFFKTAPTQQQIKITDLYEKIRAKYQSELEATVINRSVQYGKEVAEAINAWSKLDAAGDEAYLRNNDPNYIPPTGPDKWQPTYPDYTAALLPHWGDVRPFAAGDYELSLRPHTTFSTEPNSELYKQTQFVHDMVNKIRNHPETNDYWIAQFWSDDCATLTFTPSGRWVMITHQVIRQENSNLAVTLEAYAKVSMALADAGIGAWKNKYIYNLLRPIDYIKKYMNDDQWNTMMCPDGTGNFFTPPFPAYPSGHAAFGAAASEVLSKLFGDNYYMIDRCHEGRTEFRGEPRAFTSFYDMAKENAYSRLPLGVHYLTDAEGGLEIGQKIGAKINQLPFRK